LFQPDDAYERALKRLNSTRAAIVLGLYPANKKWTWHTVEADRTGRVRRIFMTRSQTKSKLGWVFAVWSSKFTEFLHKYLAVPPPNSVLSTELTVGETIAAAIRAGLRTQSVIFPHRNYLDIGTPADLQRVASAEWSK